MSSVLIVGEHGHILLDGALPQSAPLIRKNIEALGYHMRDVKLIVNSHAHYDHAGGIAALQRYSGAEVAASPSGAQVLRDGTIGPDDPQYDRKRPIHVPKVSAVREVMDQETLRVGTWRSPRTSRRAIRPVRRLGAGIPARGTNASTSSMPTA